ncbi:MAG: hypothetical protein SFV21_20245 [Rhodospirillaceae bacterium]|nr:hypothetical protein [Rhodospirillaceae bacterium]
MKVEIIKIGNSRGVRLPKAVLDQCSLHATADLSVEHGAIVIRPRRRPRHDWDARFAASANAAPKKKVRAADDGPLPDHVSQVWDRREWRW